MFKHTSFSCHSKCLTYCVTFEHSYVTVFVWRVMSLFDTPHSNIIHMSLCVSDILFHVWTYLTFIRDLIESHPLTPELSAELFAQKGIGALPFSAVLIEWSQSELEGLQKIWVQAYKNAWHVCVLLCFIKPILGNRYGPGVSPYDRGPGVAGSSPFTLTYHGQAQTLCTPSKSPRKWQPK